MAAQCILYGYFANSRGDALVGAKLSARIQKGWFHGYQWVCPTVQESTTGIGGYLELVMIETETVGKRADLWIEFSTGASTQIIYFRPITVPNQSSADLKDLLVPM